MPWLANQTPPSQVIIGLAMFLTFFVMAPTFTQVYEGALAPYLSGEMSQAEALEQGSRPIRQFMMKHTREKDLAVFYEISNHERPGNAGTGTDADFDSGLCSQRAKVGLSAGLCHFCSLYRHRYGGGIDVNGHGDVDVTSGDDLVTL